ncbi:MAG: hypothetical protein RIQ93_1271 [Verrucomicrobiota bacterium]|jgi:hypothetical protein
MRSPGYYWWAFRREWRRGFLASWADHWLAPRIWRWQNPHAAEVPAAVPVHVLCGHEQVLLTAWMLASWHSHTGRNWVVRVHDDGTLTPEDVGNLCRISDQLHVITSAAADAAVAPHLANRPACAAYRGAHPLARKIIDVPLLSESRRFILLDSDVLFFRQPEEILQWVDDPTDDRCWFNEDVAESSNVTPFEAQERLGVTPVPRVNSGLCLLPAAVVDLDFCERALRDTALLNGHIWRVEQTLFALCAARHSRSALLPRAYEVSLGAAMQPGAIARHYVGAVRDRFWSEGVWKLAAQLSSR